MKKAILIPGIILGAATVTADLGDCPMFEGGYGMMGGYGYGGWWGPLIWLLYVAVAALVFGLIFWGVRKWFMDKDKDHHGHSHAHRKH